ncbi:unnamed protein product [Cylicocyclus nassatus]|uniref:Uncharacterized protein n=1 Tax=Cylicocyclus nassatus TaxID=53992 RepID=A0AA36GJZ8_CYLNA|nr:unnamed protein product [Cylicocyclus nassatus]
MVPVIAVHGSCHEVRRGLLVAKNKFNANEQSKGDKRYPAKIIGDLVCEVRTSHALFLMCVAKSFATSYLQAWR